MKNFSRIVSLLILSIIISSCGQDKNESKKPMTFSLREAWFPWAGYVGEVIAEYDVDSIYNIEFKVAPGAEDIDPIKLVLSGQNDFGIASAENLILSNQKGADLVAIGVLNYKSPTCYITLANSGITELKDFEGKTIGILTGTETETIYRLLVAENNIDKSKLREIEAPFDLSSFIVTGDYDVRPAFIYDEPVTLELQGVDFNVIRPEDYGVNIMGAVYFTKRETIEESPEKVQAFVNIIAEGWEIALSKPDYAIELLDRYDKDVDENRELLSLKKGLEYFKGEDGKVLYVNDNAWIEMAEKLKFLEKINKDFDVKKSFDNSFVKKYHKL